MPDKSETITDWNSLYEKADTAWDVGHASPAITKYIDGLTTTDIPILIPGCGNAYEAEYLLQRGFTDITLIDIAPKLTAALEEKFKQQIGSEIKVITGDFFKHQGEYQLMLEQTFLSALPPVLRKDYANQMHRLLKQGGSLTGVLFSKVFEGGPPFGGTIDEYQKLFSEKFDIIKLEPCYNSIERRQGSEAFIHLVAK